MIKWIKWLKWIKVPCQFGSSDIVVAGSDVCGGQPPEPPHPENSAPRPQGLHPRHHGEGHRRLHRLSPQGQRSQDHQGQFL